MIVCKLQVQSACLRTVLGMMDGSLGHYIIQLIISNPLSLRLQLDIAVGRVRVGLPPFGPPELENKCFNPPAGGLKSKF